MAKNFPKLAGKFMSRDEEAPKKASTHRRTDVMVWYVLYVDSNVYVDVIHATCGIYCRRSGSSLVEV